MIRILKEEETKLLTDDLYKRINDSLTLCLKQFMRDNGHKRAIDIPNEQYLLWDRIVSASVQLFMYIYKLNINK